METIELDFDKRNDLLDLQRIIRKGAVKFGTYPIKIRLFISHNISDTTYAAYMILLVEYFTRESFSKSGKSEKTKDFDR